MFQVTEAHFRNAQIAAALLAVPAVACVLLSHHGPAYIAGMTLMGVAWTMFLLCHIGLGRADGGVWAYSKAHKIDTFILIVSFPGWAVILHATMLARLAPLAKSAKSAKLLKLLKLRKAWKYAQAATALPVALRAPILVVTVILAGICTLLLLGVIEQPSKHKTPNVHSAPPDSGH